MDTNTSMINTNIINKTTLPTPISEQTYLENILRGDNND